MNECKDFIDEYPNYLDEYLKKGCDFYENKIYCEFAYNDVKDTIKMLERVLKEEAFKQAEFYYHWSV